ncbi:MAG TPA: PH domain-containing protein [Methanoregula sp.]|nr:PH domain-containing protein [Methanoregula sp.]
MSIQIPKDMTLTEGEIPIWFGQMSWISWWLILLIAAIFAITIYFFIIAVILVIIVWINVSTSEYFISSKRIYFKRGLISRVLNDIKIEWVTNIFVHQGIVGRILNFGNIGISSPGERGGAIGFVGVSDPMKIKAIIEDTLIKYKKNP